jgi:hypothetical protein
MNGVADWWQHFWEHAAYWDAFWPAVWGALVGAIAATALERRYRKQERISREVGECSKLLFILGRMLWMLEDLDDSFIGGQRKKLGREPTWEEIGALPGAPMECPAIIIGEYTFLLEDVDPSSLAPEMLSRAYTVEARIKVILARLSERSMLFHEYNNAQASNMFIRGTEAMRGMSTSGAIAARIKELTEWLGYDIPASIESIKTLLAQLIAVLGNRYPKRQFSTLISVTAKSFTVRNTL